MKQTSRSFKLIGLKVMDNCSDVLRKILRPGGMYFFSNEYEEDGKGFIRIKKGVQELAGDFFLSKNHFQPLVNVSCIVGQNGDGKSSLVELMVRILNNFSYSSGFRSDHGSLRFIPDLFARLYYRIDSDICCISCEGRIVDLLVNGESVWRRDLDNQEKSSEWEYKINIKEHSSQLFYTLVNNYSLYAYNSREFKSETQDENEDNSWIENLFHKNDAYQTPVVLSPMRTKGIIDVNREYDLSMQRFGELFLNCKDGKFKISNNEVVEGIAYKLESDSKLFTRTIRAFLLDPKRGARDVIIFNKSLSYRKGKRKYALNTAEESVVQENIHFWKTFDGSFYDSGLLEIARTIVVRDNTEGITVESDTDLYKYLTYMKTITRKKEHIQSMINIEEFLSRGGGLLTFMQFQRLYLVFEVFKRWMLYSPEIEFRTINFQRMTLKDHAVWYLVYKTIRVIETYPDYFSGGVFDYELPQHFFNDTVRKNNLKKWFEALIGDIEKDKSHITLKLRQILYYLDTFESQLFYPKSTVNYTNSIQFVLRQFSYDHFIDAEEYYEFLKKSKELASAIPPPIFHVDYLISRGGPELYPLSRMSSGERQLLNSASSIVYHLKNIRRSKTAKTKIVYENINVILEEVELYFHPEYQRRFVMYLLEQISNAHLSSRLAINLVFVTHSPFILSDIPRQNVLFLRDGAPDRSMQEDTFGANIHTLLQNGFFLSSVPIGEFAKDKINEMFAILNCSEKVPSSVLDRLATEIPLVSEPLLRGQLMKLYGQRKMFSGSKRDYLQRLNDMTKELEDLKKRLDDSYREE